MACPPGVFTVEFCLCPIRMTRLSLRNRDPPISIGLDTTTVKQTNQWSVRTSIKGAKNASRKMCLVHLTITWCETPCFSLCLLTNLHIFGRAPVLEKKKFEEEKAAFLFISCEKLRWLESTLCLGS
jgi:hypothetical protein